MNTYSGTKSRRLDSWKEIAAYLGRDVRTVIRWEKDRGLPVSRDASGPGRPTVFADPEELDRWLMGHAGEAEPEANTTEVIPVEQYLPGWSVGRHPYRIALVCLGGALLMLGVAVGGHGVWMRGSERHLQFARVDFPATAPMSVGIADFDGDGNLDVAFTNSGSDSVDVIFGDGHGGFSRRTSLPNAKEPERLTIGDFNHDGHPDLAVTHRGSHDLIVLLGDGHGGFRESFRWAAGGRSRWVTASDVNQDGIEDLVVACSATHKVAVLLGRGDGTFDRIHQYDTNGEPAGVVVGDFTHDNIPDLVTADYQFSGGTTISLYAGNGDGTFRARESFTTGFGPLGITTADFNRDGSLDIATADFRDSVSVLLSTSAGFSAPRLFSARNAPGFIASGDFDGDGNPDLLMVAEHSNDAHLYYGDGRGNFRSSQVFGTGAYPDSIAVADLDHDGRLDFVVAATYGNLISVYLNRTP